MSQEEYQPSGTAEIEERTDAYLNKAGEEEPDGAEEEKTEETEKMPIRPPAAVPEALAGKRVR